MDEKIEVGYRKIGEVLGKDYHHKFLIYTDKEGAQHTISGWTGTTEPGLPYGKIHVKADMKYDANNPDYPSGSEVGAAKQPQYRELIATHSDLSLVWKQMTADAKSKDGKYPYDPQLQNSNTLADSVLRDIKLPEPKKDGPDGHWAPASGRKLDESLKPVMPGLGNSGRTLSFTDGDADTLRDTQLRADPLYKQALAGLDRLGAVTGLYADEAGKENLAAALAAKARSQTPALPEIHDVIRGGNGENLFAVWKNPGNEQHMLRAHVAVDEAVRHPAEQSLQVLASANEQLERVQQDQVEQNRAAIRMG